MVACLGQSLLIILNVEGSGKLDGTRGSIQRMRPVERNGNDHLIQRLRTLIDSLIKKDDDENQTAMRITPTNNDERGGITYFLFPTGEGRPRPDPLRLSIDDE